MTASPLSSVTDEGEFRLPRVQSFHKNGTRGAIT